MTDEEIAKLKLMNALHSETLYDELWKYFCINCKYYLWGTTCGLPKNRLKFNKLPAIYTCFEKENKDINK